MSNVRYFKQLDVSIWFYDVANDTAYWRFRQFPNRNITSYSKLKSILDCKRFIEISKEEANEIARQWYKNENQ